MAPWRIPEQEDLLLCVSCFLVSKHGSMSLTKIEPSYHALKLMNQQASIRVISSFVLEDKGDTEIFSSPRDLLFGWRPM